MKQRLHTFLIIISVLLLFKGEVFAQNQKQIDSLKQIITLAKQGKNKVITLLELGGRLIESKEYNGTKLLNLKIDEPAGIYLLKIETGDQKAVIRLIKE